MIFAKKKLQSNIRLCTCLTNPIICFIKKIREILPFWLRDSCLNTNNKWIKIEKVDLLLGIQINWYLRLPCKIYCYNEKQTFKTINEKIPFNILENKSLINEMTIIEELKKL